MTPLRPAMADLLVDIRGFLKGEKELFGNAFLIDPGHPGKTSMARSKPERKKPPNEPLLFETSRTVPGAMTNEPWGNAQTLTELHDAICTCVKCPLGHTRTKFVFGTGNPAATLMVIGEAPGADEDAQGEPFVGRAGQLLNKILEAINFKREDVYICNILKCRPPNNRNPEPDEVAACSPFLRHQLASIRPKIVCCLGTFAAQTVMQTATPISRLRGTFHDMDGIRVIATFHPAYLLRSPDKKREVWEDMKQIRAELFRLRF